MKVATVFSLVGLCFEIGGAWLLVRGILRRDMVALKAMRKLLEQEPSQKNSVIRRVAVRWAFLFGSKDIESTTPDYIGSYAETFWGLVLLVLGFLLQLVGQAFSVERGAGVVPSSQATGWSLEARLGMTSSDAQIVYSFGSLILAGALVWVTIWYARSTRAMVDEMRRQDRPYVYIVCDEGRLRIRNSGNRSAHYVRIDIIKDANMAEGEFRQEGENTVLGLARFSSAAVIQEGVRTLGPGAERSIGTFARPAPARRVQIEYRVSYQDGNGTPYSEMLNEEYQI